MLSYSQFFPSTGGPLRSSRTSVAAGSSAWLQPSPYILSFLHNILPDTSGGYSMYVWMRVKPEVIASSIVLTDDLGS